ncbi:50S ribosomal protein L11 methyltransferase [Flavimaricola marinus]|uniref:Ribosomal protein L11 methyltransferase n=1 Tax=Flavimaricola marinus TaxID=1819565 RepID=A0A238LCF5_9RHOB|nr:50S ribosomal protein L11 methyltransferase [Flavimaricola marinus]SMY07369.1 ribosomal protein L11 methyltransferase [Flavimaricola marinus]
MSDARDKNSRLGLSDKGRALISQLRVPRSEDALHDAGMSAELLGQMVEHGLLETQGETRQSVDYSDTYVSWKSQKGMLIDHTRTLAYQRAIEAVVTPGDIAIDVGTGSGILAMMAARAGAKTSYGLELTGMAVWADQLARSNGLDAVQIVRGDAADFASAEPADVVISEFQGMYLIDEWRHYAAFVKVRDANLAKGGSVVPRAGAMYLSAIDSRSLYMNRGYGFWESPVYGFDYSAARASDIDQPLRYIVTADNREIVDTQKIRSFDFLNGNERDYVFETEVTFDYAGAGAFHGLIGHFDLDMAPGQVLSTSMASRETHWHQSYFPMPQIQVPAGGQVTIRVRSFLDTVSEDMALGFRLRGPGDSDFGAERVFSLGE